MRHINLDLIKNKVKKISWDEVNKSHLNELKYTDSTDKHEYVEWEKIRDKHINNLKTLNPKERKKYMAKYPDWNILQKVMIEEFGYKCWYSEAPIGNGDFEIDHFRPKNRARQGDEDNTVNKENGYWWLAYNLDNFRLSGALANKRRRDRLKTNSEIEGKGDLFPLDLINGKVASDEASVFNEIPLLIDPIDASDVGLLTFDEDGKIIPNPISDDFEKNKAEITIKLYHLDLSQLDVARRKVWNLCSRVIEEALQYYQNAKTYDAKKLALKKCNETLLERTDKKSEFSAVAIACVNSYRKRENYKELIQRLGI